MITLTTDFGTSDWFVGTMKGVIACLAPRTRIVDLTHDVPAGDIRAGAFALAAGCRFFPRGTIHLAVVDPGVGSKRRAIAVRTRDYFFVGPDNGVLSFALRNETIKSIRALENEAYFLRPVSHTFHGRDIFSPVAAHLSRGVPFQKLGRQVKNFTWLCWPEPRRTQNGIEGEVIYIDRFGNAITNLETAELRPKEARHIIVGRKRLCPIGDFYQSAKRGKPIAVPGSSGFLEIAINGGSAADVLALKVGSSVVFRHF